MPYKQVTVSALLPVIKHMKSKLFPVSSDCRLAKETKQVIWSDLQGAILNISSFLDPRFKVQHLQNREETVSAISLECMDYYETTQDRSRERLSAEPQDNAVNNPPPAKRLKGLAAVLKNIEQEEGQTACASGTLTPTQRIEKEISPYLTFQQLNRMQNLLLGERGSRVDSLTLPT